MTISPKIPLTDLLAMIILLLVHPHLASGFYAAIWLAPRQVFALAGALVAAAVLQAFVGAAEILRVCCGVVFEFVVPGEIGACVAGGFGDVATGWGVGVAMLAVWISRVVWV